MTTPRQPLPLPPLSTAGRSDADANNGVPVSDSASLVHRAPQTPPAQDVNKGARLSNSPSRVHSAPSTPTRRATSPTPRLSGSLSVQDTNQRAQHPHPPCHVIHTLPVGFVKRPSRQTTGLALQLPLRVRLAPSTPICRPGRRTTGPAIQLPPLAFVQRPALPPTVPRHPHPPSRVC